MIAVYPMFCAVATIHGRGLANFDVLKSRLVALSFSRKFIFYKGLENLVRSKTENIKKWLFQSTRDKIHTVAKVVTACTCLYVYRMCKTHQLSTALDVELRARLVGTN